MKRGVKGFGHASKNGALLGRTSKGRPQKVIAQGLASYPTQEIYQNPDKVDVSGKTQIREFGDSYTFGSNASPSSNAYANRFPLALGITDIVNYSAGGKGIWHQAAAAQGASWTQGLVLITVMVGLNDIRRNGDAPKTLKKLETGLKAIFLKGMIGAQAYSGSTAVTRSPGTFAGYAGTSVGGSGSSGALPAAGRASFNTSGAGAVWTWTASFTSFAIQMFGADGVTYQLGTAIIAVDGITVYNWDGSAGWYDAITDGVYDNGRGPVPLFFWGFASGSHTVTITTTSATAVAVDFFCPLLTPAQSPAIIVYEIPYLPNAGYQLVANPYGSRTKSKNAERVVLNLIREFRQRGFNYGYAPTNRFLSENNIDRFDLVHPDNAGHSQLTRAGLNAIKAPYPKFLFDPSN